MANEISYSSAYLKMLDEIYKAASCTAILEANPLTVKFSQENAKTVYMQELTIDGLANYTRAGGYVDSDVDLYWRAYTLAQEWGVKLTLDALDLKNAYLEILQVAAVLQREKVVPQVDAYRFEKLCTTCGLDVSADLDADTAVEAWDVGVQTLDDAEAPQGDRVAFISNTMYKLLKSSGEFFNVRVSNQANGVINRNIEAIDDIPIIRVPAARFCNDFNFPTTTAGAFTKASGSKDLNLVIASKSAVAGVMKYADAKVVDKKYNTDKDGYVYGYRNFHDLFVHKNKEDYVYIHAKSTTN
jgi:hypothetical protein